MHHFTIRNAACCCFRADALKKADALHAQQEKAQHGAQDHQTQCREDADMAADDHKTGDLDEWHCQHDERGERRRHVSQDLLLFG
jgi:hypothetical protein